MAKVWMLKWQKLAMFSPLFFTKKEAENYIAKLGIGGVDGDGCRYHAVKVEIKEV